MKKLTTTLIVGGFILASVPLYAYAQTYAYIDVSGALQLTTANTPEEAIQTAPNRAVHSGVMIIGTQTITTQPGGPNAQWYEYVTVTGQLKTIAATSAQQAEMLASDRAPHSGVMVVAK